jgi:SsrA-binding protein
MTSKGKTAPKTGSQAGKSSEDKPVYKVISDNRRARHEYEIIEVFQCGIALAGTEVKALRTGRCSLQDSYAQVNAGEVWLCNCNISPYEFGNRFNHEPTRKRKLLLHAREIFKLHQRIKEKGLTLIPLRMYFKRNWVKVDLALAKGKQLFDKRESLARKDSKRQLDRLTRQVRMQDRGS